MSRRRAKSTHVAPPPKPSRLSDGYAVSRRIAAKYDAAQTTTDNSNHWAQADHYSADAALSPTVRRTLRSRSRYEAANNTYCSGMIRTLANDTIGVGPTLQMLGGTEDDAAIESAFWLWAQSVRLAEKLRLMRMAKCRDGETFATFITNFGLRSAVKLDLRLYEADQVATSLLGNVAAELTDGVLLDDFGNVTGYLVLKRHPGDTTYFVNAWETETIPARDMIHLLNAERPNQHRGVPEIAPALPLYAQLRRFTLAVIAAAETAADIAGVIQSTAVAGDPDDIEPLDAIDIARRQLLTMPKGWALAQLKAEQPATTYEMFKRQIINEIARCLNMPYNVAAGDSSSYNYSSGRLDHKTYFKSLRVERMHWETACLDPILDRWFQEARLVPGLLPPSLRAAQSLPPHEWRWEGDEEIDPLKDAQARQVRLATGMTSRAREYARDGLDMEAEDIAAAASFGVTVDEYRRRLFDSTYANAAAVLQIANQQGDDNAEPV